MSIFNSEIGICFQRLFAKTSAEDIHEQQQQQDDRGD